MYRVTELKLSRDRFPLRSTGARRFFFLSRAGYEKRLKLLRGNMDFLFAMFQNLWKLACQSFQFDRRACLIWFFLEAQSFNCDVIFSVLNFVRCACITCGLLEECFISTISLKFIDYVIEQF